ncbi:hypothetical protein ACMZOO_02775 [Catenovulum sp. SX2]|uniref:hypothetical protein n=1 Tax=Catenovulum sp. SX2 TaxID=3398614 RepID=UPI003F8619DE
MKVFILVCILFVVSCGNSTNQEDNEFAGYWYSAFADVYLDINRKGHVRLRECSLYEGYSVNESASGQIINDNLKFGEKGFEQDFIVSFDGTSLQIASVSDVENGEPTLFTKQTSIPEKCENDVVEITYYSPKQVQENDLIEFTVDFEYRLSSAPNAIIEAGFTSSDSGSFVLTNEEFEVSSSGIGSGFFTPTTTATAYGSNKTFSLHLIMYVPPTGTAISFSPIASDKVDIRVILADPSNNKLNQESSKSFRSSNILGFTKFGV